MSSYFINQQINQGQGYRNIKAYRHFNQEQGCHALLTLGNILHLYKILNDGLALQNSYQFACNIAKIQVIPSPQHSSDYVWILDSLGRFGFWHPDRGLQIISNNVLSDSYNEALSYNQLNVQIMSGISYKITQKENVGTIFFTIQNSLVFMEFAINKEGALLGKVWQENIYIQNAIRFVNWIKNTVGHLFLGIVRQQDTGTTVLEVYAFIQGQSILDSKPVWILNKKNILHFRAAENGDLLVVTYDEVALHRFKQNNPIKCYRTKGNYGQGFCLRDGFYGHLGKQLVIFSKDELKTFNDFKFIDESLFESGGFVQSSCLGSMDNGCLMVGIITHRSQVYLLRIIQKKCQILKHNFGLFAVQGLQTFSLHRNTFAMIGTSHADCHQVLLSRQVYSCPIEKEQSLPVKVDTLASTVRGGFIIMGVGLKNYVLRMSRDQDFQFYFDLPEGQFIHACDSLLVLHNGIYQMDYQTQKAQRQVEDEVLLAQAIDQNCYFLNSKGNIQLWNTSSKEASLLAEGHILDYCWGTTLNTYSLMSANSATPKQLELISEQGISTVSIQGHTLVSSLSCLAVKGRREVSRVGNKSSEQLLIGYADGVVHVQSHSGQLTQVVQLLQSNYVSFQRIRQDQMLLSCGSNQYLLVHSPQGISLRQIQLSVQGSSISNITYLSKCNKLIYIQRTCGNQFLLESSLNFSNQINKITSIYQSDSLPFIKTKKNSIVIANNNSIVQYSLRVGKIVRQAQLGYTQICGFEEVKMGLMLIGIDKSSNPFVYICNQELQTVYNVKIDVKKPIYALKVITGTNDFFLWSVTNVSLHRIDATGHIKLLFGSQLDLQTNSVSLNIQNNLFLANDPDRYLSVYNYDSNINHIADLLPSYKITASAFIGNNIVISDQRGCLNLFQIDRVHSFINRSVFVKQGTINIGQQIQAVHQTDQVLYYVTSDCCIYQLRLIERQDFDLLHRLEENILKLQKKQSMFEYYKWRSKIQCDKIIDGSYLSMILKNRKHPISSEFQVEKYQQVIARFSP